MNKPQKRPHKMGCEIRRGDPITYPCDCEADTYNLACDRWEEYHNEIEAQIKRYLKAFSHIHEAGKVNIDTCDKCGLDLRDEIHIRGN